MRIYSRGSQHLTIFPDKPQWLVVDDTGKDLLEMLFRQHLTVGEIMGRFPLENREEIQLTCLELLEIYGTDDADEATVVASPLTSRISIAMIGITRRCNLQCPHCYVDARGALGAELDLVEHVQLARQINESLATNPAVEYEVNLTGGEPFKHKGILAIIRAYRDTGLGVTISTNGLLIRKSQIPILRELEVALSVSLDGARAKEHDEIRGEGTFQKVIRKISTLIQGGVKIGINHLLHSGNAHSLEQTIDLAYQLGCSGFNPINLVQLGRACDSSLQRVPETDIFRRIANHLALHPEQAVMFEKTSLFSSMGAALLSGVACISSGVGNRPCVYVTPEGRYLPLREYPTSGIFARKHSPRILEGHP